jgi:thiol-disulfide isomerase/thioredoxin
MPARLALASLLVLAGAFGLWRAGALSGGERGSVAANADGRAESLVRPADASLATAAPPGLSVGLREGEVAPDFEFSDFEGKRQRLSQYRGRAVVLNFWATWCPPCRAELPDLQAVLESHPAGDLVVLGVNAGESYARAARYLSDIDVRLTAFAYDPEGAIVRRYSLPGMPVTYFIDRDGRITRVHTGQISRAVAAAGAIEAIAGYDSIER